MQTSNVSGATETVLTQVTTNADAGESERINNTEALEHMATILAELNAVHNRVCDQLKKSQAACVVKDEALREVRKTLLGHQEYYFNLIDKALS